MPRIKIALPDKYIFQTEIPVRITDINYRGHLGNDSLLSIFHEARIRLLKHLGYSESDIDGVGMGLYISKRIVDLHKGLIWVESEGRNKGSTFFVKFPIDG